MEEEDGRGGCCSCSAAGVAIRLRNIKNQISVMENKKPFCFQMTTAKWLSDFIRKG